MSNIDLTNELVISVIMKRLRKVLEIAEYELQSYRANDSLTYSDGFDDGENYAYTMVKEELEEIISEFE